MSFDGRKMLVVCALALMVLICGASATSGVGFKCSAYNSQLSSPYTASFPYNPGAWSDNLESMGSVSKISGIYYLVNDCPAGTTMQTGQGKNSKGQDTFWCQCLDVMHEVESCNSGSVTQKKWGEISSKILGAGTQKTDLSGSILDKDGANGYCANDCPSGYECQLYNSASGSFNTNIANNFECKCVKKSTIVQVRTCTGTTYYNNPSTYVMDSTGKLKAGFGKTADGKYCSSEGCKSTQACKPDCSACECKNPKPASPGANYKWNPTSCAYECDASKISCPAGQYPDLTAGVCACKCNTVPGSNNPAATTCAASGGKLKEAPPCPCECPTGKPLNKATGLCTCAPQSSCAMNGKVGDKTMIVKTVDPSTCECGCNPAAKAACDVLGSSWGWDSISCGCEFKGQNVCQRDPDYASCAADCKGSASCVQANCKSLDACTPGVCPSGQSCQSSDTNNDGTVDSCGCSSASTTAGDSKKPDTQSTVPTPLPTPLSTITVDLQLPSCIIWGKTGTATAYVAKDGQPVTSGAVNFLIVKANNPSSANLKAPLGVARINVRCPLNDYDDTLRASYGDASSEKLFTCRQSC